jgi:hypothetical protein
MAEKKEHDTMNEEDLITLHTYPSQMHAEMARVTLEAHDIPAVVTPETTYLNTARLMVHQGNASAATKILANLDDVPIPEEEGA